jgi:hypothetical protein
MSDEDKIFGLGLPLKLHERERASWDITLDYLYRKYSARDSEHTELEHDFLVLVDAVRGTRAEMKVLRDEVVRMKHRQTPTDARGFTRP